MTKLHTLTFEIGTEEIPAFDLHKATLALPQITEQALESARIPHGEITVLTTPRRLIVMVSDVADTTEALDEVFRGPSVAIAFDSDGKPTKAAEGFARGKGVGVDALERRFEGDVEYVFATRSLPASDVAELLPEVLSSIISAISWPKSCRWGRTHEYFSRPVRWLVALLDEQVIPVEFAGLVASNETCGHRFLSPGPHTVSTAADLPAVLESAYVLTSEKAREEAIREGVACAEKTWNAHAELPEKTLLEVTNLCEYPTVLVGAFDEEFLLVPEEIIVDAMLMHQRYFPLYDDNHKLTNHFILVSNGNPECAETIIDGNERVVRARLSDAKFFYEEDLKRALDTYVDRLDEVVFQESLGTMRAKTDRVVGLAEHLAKDAGLDEADSADVARAAYLAKADLVTNAVVEFTSVQGIMGSYYATAAGETDQVAQAIADHYRPRFAGDDLPISLVGRIVATADKLDTICGLFVVGQGPTGSSDPFALRRSAIGIIAMLEAGLHVSLVDAVNASLDTYQASGVEFDRQAIYDQIIEFFVTRTKVILRDSGVSPDSVEAVLATGIVEPAVIIARARALEAARTQSAEVFDDLATAYARANNLADQTLGDVVDASLMDVDELALDKATNEAAVAVERALAEDNYAAALEALASLRTPIDTFFEDVLIMDKDEALRNNRLRLLNRFVAVFAHVADFAKMTKASK
ncbi:glycine--tRNA ligase subunit beta [Adlercreutzia agrestimuris]|uniref:glycine--tRNA ligase subunit beta n=1 Tax=Adlercreutzia agrestimuris TaxID=2941324 RepID=UPI00203F62AC|nr:glycine--tRNA ligase subunit beta [Adlercreutzia agrestimuris]